jgi:hypothetical protein
MKGKEEFEWNFWAAPLKPVAYAKVWTLWFSVFLSV